MNGGGLFNQTGSTTTPFGQSQPQNQTSQFGGFGASSSNTGLFGQSKPAGLSGGLFGSTANTAQPGANTSSSAPATPTLGQFGTNSSTNAATGASLFGSKPANPTGGSGLFGGTQTANTAQPSGGLFGASLNSNANNSTSGGLFGNTQTGSTSTNLFGGSTTTQTAPTTGGLFGNTNTAQTGQTSNLFGSANSSQAPAQSTSLFGGTNTANNTGTSLFGKTSAPATSNNLFGTTANATAPATGSSLFGNSTAGTGQQTTSLFGKPATSTTTTTTGAPATTGVSVFGSQMPGGSAGTSSSLFGKQPNTTTAPGTTQLFNSTNPVNGTSGRLFATIEQPSFVLPGQQPSSAGSQKLYKSLTAGLQQPQKDSSRAPTANKRAAPVKPVLNVKNPSPSPATKQTEPRKPESRKLINSYEKYVQERPTNLVIRRAKRPALSLPDNHKLAIENGSTRDVQDKPVNGKLETTAPNPALSVAESIQDSTIPSADISLFHKQAQTVTLVRVNKATLEQGYFIRPGLDELAAYSKQQLKNVRNLVIGRDNFGQLSYSEPVDLSEIENLGDILGRLVVFDRGTVCVYPDDGVKAERGRELNIPCTVTIENAFPLDSEGQPIVSMADPRVAKHVAKLRKANESQGAEFITFSHGVWVFKVPHFSVWGLTPDEMIVDDVPNDTGAFEEEMDVQINGVSSAPRSRFAAPEVNSAKPTEPEPSLTTNTEFREVAPLFPRTSTPDADQPEDLVMADPGQTQGVPISAPAQPSKWTNILASSHILAASDGALTEASNLAGPIKTSDLNKILFNARDSKGNAYDELRRPRQVFISKSLLVRGNTPSGARKARLNQTVFDASVLKPLAVRSPRSPSAGGLLRFKTNVTFSQLQQISPNPLWPICSVIFDGDAAISRRERLSNWLVEQTSSSVRQDLAAATDDFDAIWILICGHRLEDAAVRAVSSENPHLATLIAQLGSPVARRAAQAQLDDWKSTDAIFYIPPKVWAIYELAAGNTGLVPAFSANGKRTPELNLTEGLDWKRTFGLKLWYGLQDVSIENVVATLPDSEDPEFLFLRLVCQPSVLNQIESLVGLPTAFLALQALQSVPQDPEVVNRVCAQLAYELLASSQLSSAVFVALHIVDDTLALHVVKDLLMRSPWSLSSALVSEMGLPNKIVLEARALYAHYAQNYFLEAELLLEAGLAEQSHHVLITEVAPHSVLNGQYDALAAILARIPTTVKGWNLGGKVYLDFVNFAQQPSSQLALRLSSALDCMPTPRVEIKAAVAIMSNLVAKHGRSTLSTPQILGMKLSSSDYRLQAMQQAAIDLVRS